jgi:tetratricopeptide (TPR) repeat protein
MSTHPLRCRDCDRECVYDRCAPFGEGQEAAYGVAWRCPDGHGLSLDVCPVGPLIPAPGLCLNCGAPYATDAADAPCRSCGLPRHACSAALGLADAADGDSIASARAAFNSGLFRRGIAILNQAIERGAEPLGAWLLKAHFLNSVGFNRAAAEMLGAAAGRFAGAADRIALLEEQSFLWAECGRGEEALGSADAAVRLGSDSPRTHFLRGRALALVGRLEEARDEMRHLLDLDPDDPDARRGPRMIEEALGAKGHKRWWQFWKT